ncbi:MAG: hypothetical protein KGV51_02920 [Moraxellaceae bacterium]|nr:hypothetical protein [Moraxellaceae bacterium]
MSKINLKLLVSVILMLYLTSCSNGIKTEEVRGIEISGTLFANQSYRSNQQLAKLIERALDKDKSAIVKIANFNCGGGAGCYDLGYVLSQIVYQLGEDEFTNLIKNFSPLDKGRIEMLLRCGLEYGDNDYDGKMDNTTLEVAFPTLSKVLTS